MPNKRNWKLWSAKFIQELNGVAGVTGIGGTIMGVGGVAAIAGTAGILISGIGTLIAGSTFIYAGYRAIPPKLQDPSTKIGHALGLSELDTFYPPLKRLALIGPMRSGKTTLKEQIAFFPRSHSRTQSLSAVIVAITGSPSTKYIAVLDGAGDVYDQQLAMIKQADYVCILVDHNEIDQAIPIVAERRREIQTFLDQMRHALSPQHQARKAWVKFIVNKKDLWEQNAPQDVGDFRDFCEQQAGLWRNSNLANKVEVIYHSNISADDINKFANNLKADL